MNRFKHFWRSLRASFWFLPSLIVAFSTVLALGLIEVDSSGNQDWMADWPRLFPENLGREPMNDETYPSRLPLPSRNWQTLMAKRNGYLQSVDTAALLRLARAQSTIASQTDNPNRRRVLREHVECIAELAERSIKSPHDQDRFENRMAQVCAALKKKPSPGHPYPTTPTEPRTQNKEQMTGSGRVTPHRP